MIFFDSSALAKAYLVEDGTPTIQGVFKRMGAVMFVSEFVALEVLTTFRISLRTRAMAYRHALSEFYRDYPNRFNVVDVDRSVRQQAFALTTSHTQARARSMDVLHIACALQLQAAFPAERVTVASSDLDLLDFARTVGLGTFDPVTEPLAALPRRR